LPVTLPKTIVRRRCAALIPYARNARTHSDQQVAQIAASIREFGFTNPALIDEEDGIIAGHGRVLFARNELSRLCLSVLRTAADGLRSTDDIAGRVIAPKVGNRKER
jgi:hypothetical protein